MDERSIADVKPDDLTRYTQCHFFAGIGGWSVALRQAGWSDDRPVWTGSCPCQPFSAAGKGEAGDDERHLWPQWFSLIQELRPRTVFGEQVEAAVGWGWLDVVFNDLEAEGYACGATVLPACSVGAPHIRQRLWFVADTERGAAELDGYDLAGAPEGMPSETRQQRIWSDIRDGELLGELADTAEPRRPASRQHDGGSPLLSARSSEHGGIGELADDPISGRREECQDGGGIAAGNGTQGIAAGLEPGGNASELGNADEPGSQGRRQRGHGADQRSVGAAGMDGGMVNTESEQVGLSRRARIAGETNFWSHLEWLPCTDGKARPVEPGSFPLAHGVQRRASKLRAYGNAIVPQAAAEFIKAVG